MEYILVYTQRKRKDILVYTQRKSPYNKYYPYLL